MITFQVDAERPHHTLECCAMHIDLIVDLIGSAGRDGVDLSETGAAGMAELLRTVSETLIEVQQRIEEQAGSAVVAPPPEGLTTAKPAPDLTDISNALHQSLGAAPRLTQPRIPGGASSKRRAA